MADDLIKKFVDTHAEAEKLVADEQLDLAHAKYLQVLDAYHAIDKSDLDHVHKELAYDQVTSLFKQINDAKNRVKIPYNLIVAGILIIAFSVLLVLKPSIVGLAGLEDVVHQPVNVSFTQSGLHEIVLKDRPLSLSVSGTFSGTAKLFYKNGDRLELIFDSENATDTTFSETCAQTCDISADSNTIELFANIDPNSELNITEISYKIQHKSNTAPTWIGSTRTFNAPLGKTTTIDLNDYFSDAENDPLVYLSTQDEGLDVSVEDSKVTITPHTSGIKNITFVASDLIDVTRVPVTIEVP